MPDPITSAATAADLTATGAGTTGGQPDYKALAEKAQAEAAEWQRRFTGLQGRFQQEQTAHTTVQAKTLELDDLVKKLTGDYEAADAENQKLEKDLVDWKGKAEQAAAKQGRFELIAKEFPQLVPFELDGLLPPGFGDELKPLLGKFSEKLAGTGKEAITEFKKGGTPPPPTEPPANTSASVLQQAYTALKAGKTDDYDRLYSQALQLKSQGK